MSTGAFELLLPSHFDIAMEDLCLNYQKHLNIISDEKRQKLF